MAPDRMQLQNMAKKSSKTFKEYAQRWRELATQVEPPLYEKEMITMFIETLQAPFYEHVLGSVSSNFSDIVTIGERIEHGLKTGKIAQGSPATTGAKNLGSILVRRKRVRFRWLLLDLIGEDIGHNMFLIIDPHLRMLRMPCRITLRLPLGRRLHTSLWLPLIMHFSPMLGVRALLKHKV